MRLMVVDDETDVQFLFQQKFRKEIKAGEVQIHYELNGRLALEFIQSADNGSSYFILTDINMPEMNGIELLKEIKSRYPKMKVIMITAYGNEHDLNIAKKLGADDYLTKPLEFSMLKEKLNSIARCKKN
jgi:CheY-like chemotaxis protein